MSVSLLAPALLWASSGAVPFAAGVPQTVELGRAPGNYTLLRFVTMKATKLTTGAKGCSAGDEFQYSFSQHGPGSGPSGVRSGSVPVGESDSGEGRAWDIAVGQNVTKPTVKLELTAPCDIELELAPQWYTLEALFSWTVPSLDYAIHFDTTGDEKLLSFPTEDNRWVQSMGTTMQYTCSVPAGQVVARLTFSEPADVPVQEIKQPCYGCPEEPSLTLHSVKYLESSQRAVNVTFVSLLPEKCKASVTTRVYARKMVIEGPYVAPETPARTPSPESGHGVVPCAVLLLTALVAMVA